MKKITHLLFLVLLITFSSNLVAQRHIEKLDRGLVAMHTPTNQIFLSWRVLGPDPDNVSFNLYRDGIKITDSPLTLSNYTDNSSTALTYTVKTVIDGIETGEENSASVWSSNYYDLPLSVPANMTMPDGSTCSFSPNDCSVGDADGDGQLEIIVKWDPSNSKDNSFSGYTGDVFIDTYKLDGTLLSRIDLGKNIRAGAHYTDFEVEDFDGDGKAEIICKTAPGTIDGKGNFLSNGPAATDNDAADYRQSNGYILSGPEYLTCFSALTGEELSTVNYIPARGTVSSWGDSYGNRVDRFLACSPYLDGMHPSAVMCRGYYTRAVLAAWDFRNGQLTSRWVYDSNSPKGANAYGQGNHNLTVGDIDDDGKDEVVWGSAAFDDDGTCLYSTGLGHGDALHMSDLKPDRKGLEVWEIHESSGAAYGEEMHDAKTGEILFGTYTGDDNGRGCSANVIADNNSFEMWSAHGPGVSNREGNVVSTSKPSMNFRIYWDGDLEDELLDNVTISKYQEGTLFTAEGCSSNNSTKATPNLSADILGDWREELILRTNDNTKLRIFSTNIPTSYKLYTLMHDATYRNAVAWQNTGYNQPPHAGFYIGNDMNTAPVSAVYDNELCWNSGSVWDEDITSSWTDSVGNNAKFKSGQKVLFDISAGTNASITINGNLSPKRFKVNSPYDVIISGSGKIIGNTDLKKNCSGSLTLNNNNDYSGNTTIWGGDFFNNGTLSNSKVFIQPFVNIGGKGTFNKDVTLQSLTSISPGEIAGETSKLTFGGSLTDNGQITMKYDFIINNNAVVSNDTILINGDWNMSGGESIVITSTNGNISPGNYTIFICNGTISGDISKLKISGIPSYLGYSVVKNGNNIELRVTAPAFLVWEGNVDNKWDNGKTLNWKLTDQTRAFSSNDSVLFNDESLQKTVVLNENVSPASILIESSETYSFGGTGSITGIGKLTKNGSAKAILGNSNTYTGKTFLNEGTLEFATLSDGGLASPIGAATNSSTNIIFNGGEMSITGVSQSTNRGMTLNTNGGTLTIGNSSSTLTMSGKITGVGKFTKDGSGKIALSTANDYRGGTLVKRGSIILTSDVANTAALGIGDTITLQGGSLIMYNSTTTSNTSTWNLKVPTGSTGILNTDGNSVIAGSLSGGGTLNYFAGDTQNILASDATAFSGKINVTTDGDGGRMILYSTKGYANVKFNLYNKVTMIYRATTDITIPIGDLTGYSNSELGAGGAGACTINWEIGNRNEDSKFSGKITNTQYSGTEAKASVTKVGVGTWTLTNENTYSGGTFINEGTIMVDNTVGSGLGTGDVMVFPTGTLAGSGSVSGAVSVDMRGSLSPGDGIGTFTVNNNVSILADGTFTVDIDKVNAKNDLLVTTGTFNMAGILEVIIAEGTEFAVGDEFKIIDGTVTGTPTAISPAIPGEGLAWDLSEFVSAGKLKVKISTGIQQPEIGSDIYPNPFKDYLTIQPFDPSEELTVSVYNLLGTEVYSQKYGQQEYIKLNIADLTRGIYMLKLQSGTKVSTHKIIKE
ncbi:MAG: autotransporter-associated beta strand repeat-containing protein [Paludibacter sp.]|nr:autotransporter-associated beta strand repeat-containing protein [Paludibacter sp.]